MTTTLTDIIDLFGQINAIPRCSKKETAICQWLEAWADTNSFACRRDDEHNLVIDVPPTAGCESLPTVVFQAHVDMVCEKRPDSDHDFDNDPITLVTDGDWLKAKDTSLGADNGIAVALGMALATDSDVTRPPMELLFTVDEETGLTGAMKLKPDFVRGRILLNVDSEDEGVFTVGCAGGEDATLTLPLEKEPIPEGWAVFKLKAGGMQGGHSGIDIGKFRANAIKVLVRGLDAIRSEHPLQLISMSGGTVHNAIPRDAEATFASPADTAEDLAAMISQLQDAVRHEYRTTEPGLSLEVSSDESEASGNVLSAELSDRILSFLVIVPSGVAEMTPDVPDLVETSNNLAVVKTKDEEMSIICSQRSSVQSRLDAICRRVERLARLAGAAIEWKNAYPPWPPDMDSALLERCRRVYMENFGKEPEVEIIHAGLECAVIGSIYPGMDMISVGPTMENPHSPDERLYLPSVERIWQFLTALLASYKE